MITTPPRTKPGYILIEVLIALMVIALILPVVSSVLSSTLRGGVRVQNKLFEINETLFVYERLQKDLRGATLKKQTEAHIEVYSENSTQIALKWTNKRLKWKRYPAYIRYLTSVGTPQSFVVTEDLARKKVRLTLGLSGMEWVWIRDKI